MSPVVIFIGFALMLICAGFVSLFLRDLHAKRFVRALVFKGCASICFIGLGAMTLFSGEASTPKILIFVGICLGIFGDEIIALCQVFPKYDMRAFIGGGSIFLIGHAFYLTALFLHGNIRFVHFASSLIVMIVLGIIYNKRRSCLRGNIKIPLALYLLVVSLVGATAYGAFFGHFTLGTALLTAGGMLFTLSDHILFAYKLGENPKFRQNVILHIAYYLAQLLIAWSIAWL